MSKQKNSAVYSSKIIKAGALLSDTKTLLVHWNERVSVRENLDGFRKSNLFGKATRSRIEDILAIFKQRYLSDPVLTNALVRLVSHQFPVSSLDRILFYCCAQSDELVHDFVTEFLSSKYYSGQLSVSLAEAESWIRAQIKAGKTQRPWSDITVTRSAQELLSTLRDFGLLEGATKKRLTPAYLPVQAFAFIAFMQWRKQPSGDRLLHSPEWRLFFMNHQAVEHQFIEADQHRFLRYNAAGSIVRIDFPVQSLVEYADVISKRAA